MKTQIAYRVKPKASHIQELQTLMPFLEIEWVKNTTPITTTTDPFYKIKIVDWTWFRTLFTNPGLSCLVLEQGELENAGITGHWGFYSLADGDVNHHFYMTNRKGLDPRAKANGFASNFAWMFVHEYLHGARWDETMDRQKAAQDVHDWEAQGLLKAKLAEYVPVAEKKQVTVSLITQAIGLIQKLLAIKQAQPTTLLHPVPEVFRRITQTYGNPNPIYTLTKHHIGVDYGTPVVTPVYAPFDGEITVAGTTEALGHYLHYRFVWNGITYIMRCAHLQSVPKLGKYKCGDDIGYTGNTGMSTGPHLHLDLSINAVNLVGINESNWQERFIDPTKVFPNS
jgi:murein DD-endopeptidase MepM/ murein hydrolase activator NlpD